MTKAEAEQDAVRVRTNQVYQRSRRAAPAAASAAAQGTRAETSATVSVRSSSTTRFQIEAGIDEAPHAAAF